MSFNLHAVAGVAAGILSFVGYVPYVITTLTGKNKPNRATWLIWFSVGAILLASYKTAGATDAIWPSVANAISMGVIVVLSVRYGEGGFSPLDLGCFITAGFGLLLWYFLDSPLTALYTCLFIDFVGAIPTLKKAYLNPEGEDYSTWIIFFIANSMNLFALAKWSWGMGFYPVYFFLFSGTMVLILTLRRRKTNKLADERTD